MFNILDSEKFKGAKKLVEVCGNVQPKEKVLIITDTETGFIGELLFVLTQLITIEASLVSISTRSSHGEPPPSNIAAAIKESDVVFMPLLYSMTHATVTEEARENGARILSMPDFSATMLKKGGIEADFPEIENTVRELSEILTEGEEANLITSKGTNLELNISNREGNPETGLSHQPGSFSSPPNIEANIGPIEGTSSGKLVVDASIPHPRLGALEGQIEIEVQGGQITNIKGGKEANTLLNILEGVNSKKAYNIAELGIGLNPCSAITGNMLEDEGAYGTAHIGVGDNIAYGGHVDCEIHIDLIMHDPTINIDGDTILKEGRLKIESKHKIF